MPYCASLHGRHGLKGYSEIHDKYWNQDMSKSGVVILILLAWAVGLGVEDVIASEGQAESVPVQQTCEINQADAMMMVNIKLEYQDLEREPSLVIEGGGFINGGFPALSSDGSQIAIIYHSIHPMEDAYPVIDIFSTKTLGLLRQINMNLESEFLRAKLGMGSMNLKSPEALVHLREKVNEANSLLVHGGFYSLPKWYDYRFMGKNNNSSECMGYRLEKIYDRDNKTNLLKITSTQTGEVVLSELIEEIKVYSHPDDPEKDCSLLGAVTDVWYVPDQQIIVARIIMDGRYCELPDEWILRRF